MIGLKFSYRTRVWFHGVVAAVINGLGSGIVLGMIDPAKFNLADAASRMNLLWGCCAFALFGLGTYLKAHPLPDPEKDTDAMEVAAKKIGRLEDATGTGPGSAPTDTGTGSGGTGDGGVSRVPVIVLLALGGSLVAGGCAGVTPVPQIPRVPDVVQSAEGDVRALAMKALQILDRATIVADEASLAYLEAFRQMGCGLTPRPSGCAIAPAADTEVRRQFVRFADLVLAGVGKIRAGVSSWEALRGILQPIVDSVNSLVGVVNTIRAAGGWRDLVRTLADVIGRAATKPGLEAVMIWPDHLAWDRAGKPIGPMPVVGGVR